MKKILIFCLIGLFNQVSGDILAKGKTKLISAIEDNENEVLVTSKDDLTAFNGEKHDVILEKGKIATETTCNIFRLLEKCGIPVAFKKQVSDTQFIASKCDMILYEVVIRREAHGSSLKRNPLLKKGDVFPKLKVEFFLKTADRVWEEFSIPKDDPFIVFNDNKMELYKPDCPVFSQTPFLVLEEYPLKGEQELFTKIKKMAKQTFLVLEKAWQNVGAKLVDLKIEFGFDQEGNLVLSDVIDNDSWRVVKNNEYQDKQYYRDGGSLSEVEEKYRFVQEKTREFRVPKQQIIVWRGSTSDNVQPFINEIKKIAPEHLEIELVTCSMHKDPIRGSEELINNVQNIPDSVIVAFVGLSNAAGPMLSANTVVPVITVPMTWKEFPEDIWSSLRSPSKVPVMTVLEQKNAALAAIKILAKSNPYLYARILEN